MTRKSKEVRKLEQKWKGHDWPKFLEWMEINGLRGWNGERINFNFPITAIVGENGTGKSTVLQSAAAAYKEERSKTGFFASSFFPDTPWERVENVSIRYLYKEGTATAIHKVRKPTKRWRGNPERKMRAVEFLDLRRTQPMYARTGFNRLAKSTISESTFEEFDNKQVSRLSSVIGKTVSSAKHSITDADTTRRVPVISSEGMDYSGFHQGAGENTIMDLLSIPFPKYGLILIDEIETSLHPRAQRRLIRDLAERARKDLIQIIVTTHSPYILDELPEEARLQVVSNDEGKDVIPGISSEFALSKMDEENYPEGDLYVEDEEAKILLREIISSEDNDLLTRVSITSFGSAAVGQSLGIMKSEDRFVRPTSIFLDGDQEERDGCEKLPGDDAPEIVVFNELEEVGWPNVAYFVNRNHSFLVDECQKAMSDENHHKWISIAANNLGLGGNDLWRAMCVSYINNCLDEDDKKEVVDTIKLELAS